MHNKENVNFDWSIWFLNKFFWGAEMRVKNIYNAGANTLSETNFFVNKRYS